LLLEAGADPHATTECGQTPLFLAARMGHREAAKDLMATTASTAQLTKYLSTPLHRASENGQAQIVADLLNKDERMANARDFFGFTPIGIAVLEKRQTTIINKLWGCGSLAEAKFEFFDAIFVLIFRLFKRVCSSPFNRVLGPLSHVSLQQLLFTWLLPEGTLKRLKFCCERQSFTCRRKPLSPARMN
jgi:ankyrin repeat protein